MDWVQRRVCLSASSAHHVLQVGQCGGAERQLVRRNSVPGWKEIFMFRKLGLEELCPQKPEECVSHKEEKQALVEAVTSLQGVSSLQG